MIFPILYVNVYQAVSGKNAEQFEVNQQDIWFLTIENEMEWNGANHQKKVNTGDFKTGLNRNGFAEDMVDLPKSPLSLILGFSNAFWAPK